MFLAYLLICVVLRAFSAQAKVVETFTECKEFFYDETEPNGMDQNAKKICQKLEGGGFYYATLYSVYHRIPLYSAYTLDPDCTYDRREIWHIEPQISQPQSEVDYMVPENDPNINKNIIKANQAMSSDYSDTGYDRGHLNPNLFQCNEGRTATFTLTNAAPMDPCFNRIHWIKWEKTLKSFLKKLNSDGFGKAYIVTGTVPNANVRIPQRENSEDSNRVTVPSDVWTAVCYKHRRDDTKSFSFGYIGKNHPLVNINLMSVSALNVQLSQLYTELTGIHQSIRIFPDDCFEYNYEFRFKELNNAFGKLINLPLNPGVDVTENVEKTYRTLQTVSSDGIPPAKRLRVTEMTVKLDFDSLCAYSAEAEKMKVLTGSNCLLTNYGPLNINSEHDEFSKRDASDVEHDEFSKSDASEQSNVECLLVPEMHKTAADGSRCLSDLNSDSCQSDKGGKSKPCCSSPCLYNDTLNGYWCTSGQTQIQCSPPYSLITVKGERCLDDYPCATYGNDYYWCWIQKNWNYCSPPLWRSKAANGMYCNSNYACGKYGENYMWCYTDNNNKNWYKCCTSDDCFSAVNEKTCKREHPCGYHGEKYLWCYTTNGSWDYCCTNCSQ